MRWWPFLVVVWIHCKVKDPPAISEPWSDSFNRGRLGADYYQTGPGYQVSAGALSARGAHNHPLWLRKKLPRNVRVEFDCWSNDARGDIKIELFGDGYAYDRDGGRYMATGYVLIFGGWSNSKSMIARRDEHASDVVQRLLPKVVRAQRYHWKIERRDRAITWWVDLPHPDSARQSLTDPHTAFLTFDDPHPLEGPGHEYLGFNNWETDTWFDNLVVTPL